jgi:hypothetical protein
VIGPRPGYFGGKAAPPPRSSGSGKAAPKKAADRVAPAAKPAGDSIIGLVNQILNLQRAPLAAAEKQRQAQAASQAQQLANVSHGLVTQLMAAAPAAGDAYKQAASATDALGRQAASYFQSQNPNAQTQATLQAIGAPVAQQQGATSTNAGLFSGGPNYVLGAAIPGASLQAQGAAQVGYAAGLPGVTALQGQSGIRNLGLASDQAHQAYLQSVQRVLGQTPQLVQQYKQAAINQASQAAQLANQKAAALANARYLAFQEGLKGKQLDLAVQKEQRSYDVAVANANTAAQRAGIYQQSVNQQGAKAKATAAAKAAGTAAKNRQTALKNRATTRTKALSEVTGLAKGANAPKYRTAPGVPVYATDKNGKRVQVGVGKQRRVRVPRATYQRVKQQAMVQPDVQLLQTRYGYSQQQISDLIDQTLAAYGWTVPGKATGAYGKGRRGNRPG